MTFSSRSNPRIAASPVALTSLGAVGGARGTAAGALRVFVEFLTTYDREAIAQLESDLRNVDHAQNNSTIAEEKRQRRLTQVKNSLAESERIVRGKLNTQLRSDLKQIEELEASRSKTNRAQGAQERATFNQTAKSLGLTKTELDLLGNKAKLTKEQERLLQRQASAETAGLTRAKSRAQIEGQINKVQTSRAALAPKLAGLAIGALGGIVGGAILGIGFQLADEAISKIGDKLQDIIDPARHARDAIAEVGAEVLKLATEQDLTLFDAATKKSEELGLAGDATASALLEQFAAQTKVNQSIQDYIKYLDAAKVPQAQRNKDIEDLKAKLIDVAEANGTLKTEQVTSFTEMGAITLDVADDTYYLAEATKQYDEITKQNTSTINENAAARSRLADATAFAKVQQDALTSALQAAGDASIAKVDTKIDNLDSGPSTRTKGIQAKIDALSSGGNSNAAALKNIAEERALILLRQRLRLLGTSINLEKYSGKFLLEAINAKIAAMDKEAAAQDRVNRLLDLQYKMGQQIKRQSGESIADFIERRAQEQRALLTEGRDIDRDAQAAKLDALKERVQDEVALEELAQRRKEAIQTQGASNYAKSLQKQLEASQKADALALANKKKALEAERAAIAKKTADAIALANTQAIEETQAAIRGAQSLSDVFTLSGRIDGLKRAKATIEGLVQGFAIPSYIAKPFLDNINKALGSYQNKFNQFSHPGFSGTHPMGGGPQEYANGGVMLLKNSSSPFGGNVKLGEEGTELGVVLSNKVASILKNQGGGPQQVGPFYVGKSDNWLRDKYALGKVVEDAVAKALRS